MEILLCADMNSSHQCDEPQQDQQDEGKFQLDYCTNLVHVSSASFIELRSTPSVGW